MKEWSGIELKRTLRRTKSAYFSIAVSFEFIRVIMGHFCAFISRWPELATAEQIKVSAIDNSTLLSDDL